MTRRCAVLSRMRVALFLPCLAVAFFLPAVAFGSSTTLRFSPSPPPLARGIHLIARTEQAASDYPSAVRPAPESARPVARRDAGAGFPAAEADWVGLSRDTAYLLGYQLLGIGILYVMPESVSNWSVEQKTQYDFGRWTDNVTHPKWDKDDFYLNYLLHPYWGSAYYLDARGRGFGRWGSFAYAYLASSLYEFGAEAFTEPVSIQDFFVTPIAGALLGVALEGVWGDLLAAGQSRSWGESVLLFLVDPLGRTNRAVDSLFGFESAPVVVRLLPVVGPKRGRGTYTGVELSMRW